jgi:threonine/homoserine/homoserine lactone efflux protein
MIDWSSYLAFLAASVALILLPGPGQAMTIARTLSGGFRAGALTAVGLNLGTLFHALAAGLGLSAILATSALAFSIVKYLGAAYLLYLGISMLRAKSTELSAGEPRSAATGAPLRQAALAGVLNHKVAVFFLAFLPQFVDPARGYLPLQFLLLGLTIAVLDTLYELLLSWLVCRTRGRLIARPGIQRLQARVTGSVLILLGLRLATQER